MLEWTLLELMIHASWLLGGQHESEWHIHILGFHIAQTSARAIGPILASYDADDEARNAIQMIPRAYLAPAISFPLLL